MKNDLPARFRLFRRGLFQGFAAIGLGLTLSQATTGRVEAADASAVAAARESIQAADVSRHVDFLASDTLEGRESGSRGGRAAGLYLEKELTRLGLKPAGASGSFYQTFNGQSRNVLALLPGSDPALSQEVVVVSAHYDHVGYGARDTSRGPIGYIHNGADDNASGVCGLLETIEAFSQLPQAPRRTILFAFWDGEEKGLLGSKHWVSQPTLPLSRVKFMVNADMIGRLTKQGLIVYGVRTGPGLREFVSRCNGAVGLDLDFDWELKANSDHWTFFDRQIPVVMLHTGLHHDYHRPSDDVERLNVPGIERAAKLLFSVALETADADRLPAWRGEARQETPSLQKSVELPPAPLPSRFGVQWIEPDGATEGLKIDRVFAGSAAARAGLRPGDRMLEFAGVRLQTSDDLRRLVWSAAASVTLLVARPGMAEPLAVNLTLDGGPQLIGITWRTDSAEPAVVILNRVVPGSPAHQAGLRLGDRVLRVEEQSFRGPAEFLALLQTATGRLSLEVERRGQLSRIEVEPIRPLAAE